MKFKTVLEGQEAVILNYLGEGRLVKGPQRVYVTKISFIIIKGFLSQFQISFIFHSYVNPNDVKISLNSLFCQEMPLIEFNFDFGPIMRLEVKKIKF